MDLIRPVDEEKAEARPVEGSASIDKGSQPSSTFAISPRTTESSSSTTPLVKKRFITGLTKLSEKLSNLWRWKRTQSTESWEPHVREIHKSPNGYPMVAAFLDSDDNFRVYRRFGYIQSRLLLEKQDDLRRLESQLDRLDRSESRNDETALMSRNDIEEPKFEARRELLQKIEAKFNEYSRLLIMAQSLTSFNKPTSEEHRSVRWWLHNRQPVYEKDAEFIDHEEDLITLRPGREHAWLDSSVEKMLQYCDCPPIRYLFQSKATQKKTDRASEEVYFTRERVDRLVVAIIVVMILVLLILPIYLLYHLVEGMPQTARTTGICIGVLLVFTLLFSACLSLFTRAKRHEILAAAAAYCAVLVVFFGNLGGNNLIGFGSKATS